MVVTLFHILLIPKKETYMRVLFTVYRNIEHKYVYLEAKVKPMDRFSSFHSWISFITILYQPVMKILLKKNINPEKLTFV